MWRRYKKIISCLMAFCMTFAGICLDIKQAGSFMEQSTQAYHVDAQIISGENASSSEHVCTQKMLGITKLSFIRAAVEQKTLRPKQRSGCVLRGIFLDATRFMHEHIEKQKLCISKACFGVIILEYIHDSDGEK